MFRMNKYVEWKPETYIVMINSYKEGNYWEIGQKRGDLAGGEVPLTI